MVQIEGKKVHRSKFVNQLFFLYNSSNTLKAQSAVDCGLMSRLGGSPTIIISGPEFDGSGSLTVWCWSWTYMAKPSKTEQQFCFTLFFPVPKLV